MNLASLVRINARNTPDKAAISYRDESITYRTAWLRIQQIAAQLVKSGVKPGDRVGLCLKDHPDHLLAHFAVACAGGIILPVDHRWSAAEKTSAALNFRSSLVLTEDEPIDGVNTLSLEHDTAPPNSEIMYDSGDANASILVSLSSGTTGKPTGALVSHSNLYERFVSQWAAIGYDSSDSFALFTPLYFGAGRSFGMSMLAVGGTLLLAPPPLKPQEINDILVQHKPTATFLPPTLLRRLLPLAGEKPRFPSLHYLLVSGEPLHADEAHECLAHLSPNLYGYYASSEGGGISILRPDEFIDFAHTVGTPTFRTDVQIVDENGKEVADTDTGRLRYRGPGVALQTLDSDGKVGSADTDGWFYPGDLASKTNQGHIVLRGRDKDVIIRGGVNIYPGDVETALKKHAEVGEAAVIGVSDGARGEIIVAFVDGTADEKKLLEHCRTLLAPYKVPSSVVVVTQIPKAPSGKVDKNALRELAAR